MFIPDLLLCPFYSAGTAADRTLIRKLISLLVFITENIQSVTLISLWFGQKIKWYPALWDSVKLKCSSIQNVWIGEV